MDSEWLRKKLREIIKSWPDVRDEDVKEYREDLIDDWKDNTSYKLYRYVPVNYYNIRNIEKGYIHLSNNGEFNDVYEGIGEVDYTSLKCEQKIALSKMANVCCFTETNSNMLMWSHYADSHKGLCIEYDLKKLSESSDVVQHLYPVLYSDERLHNCIISDLADELIVLSEELRLDADHGDFGAVSNILPLLLCKSNHWEYEKEWRIVYTLKDYYDDRKDIDWSNFLMECDCITAVYCGVRCNKDIVDHLSEISQRKKDHFTLYQMNIDTQGYNLVSKQIH